MNEQLISVAGQPPRRSRSAIRSTCQQQTATSNPVPPAAPVRVRFGYWQGFPSTMLMPPCGVPEKSGWKMRMFHLLDDLSETVVAGGTVSEATLRASGRPWQPVETVSAAEAAELSTINSEPSTPAFDADFWQAMHAAWDMAEDGDLPMTITALEMALHMATVQRTARAASEDGVKV